MKKLFTVTEIYTIEVDDDDISDFASEYDSSLDNPNDILKDLLLEKTNTGAGVVDYEWKYQIKTI